MQSAKPPFKPKLLVAGVDPSMLLTERTLIMQVFPSRNQFQTNPAATALLQVLEQNEEQLGLREAALYNSFPLYKDDEDNVVVADTLLLSPAHGVVTFALSSAVDDLPAGELQRCAEISEQVPPFVQSRLIKNKHLRKGPTSLSFEITPVVFGPLLRDETEAADVTLLTNNQQLEDFLQDLQQKTQPLGPDVFKELIASIEGAKGLIRPKKRNLASQDERTKGKQAELVEAAITLFDQEQKWGMMGTVTGPQRVRGLAGSGKTVVLAMKAAQLHLKYREAHIAFTFWTKSLYQLVKRLITRFYRQFDDRDPDWDHMHILHAWGSKGTPGVYAVACEKHGVPPISFRDAGGMTFGDRFDYVCSTFMKDRKIEPIYDYCGRRNETGVKVAV